MRSSNASFGPRAGREGSRHGAPPHRSRRPARRGVEVCGSWTHGHQIHRLKHLKLHGKRCSATASPHRRLYQLCGGVSRKAGIGDRSSRYNVVERLHQVRDMTGAFARPGLLSDAGMWRISRARRPISGCRALTQVLPILVHIERCLPSKRHRMCSRHRATGAPNFDTMLCVLGATHRSGLWPFVHGCTAPHRQCTRAAGTVARSAYVGMRKRWPHPTRPAAFPAEHSCISRPSGWPPPAPKPVTSDARPWNAPLTTRTCDPDGASRVRRKRFTADVAVGSQRNQRGVAPERNHPCRRARRRQGGIGRGEVAWATPCRRD